MPRKQVWTVRVVNHNATGPLQFPNGVMPLPGLWLEQLRYMGYARELASYKDRNVIEFTCPDPRGIDTKIWAEQNASRMRSFGIDAAAAPQWSTEQFDADTRGAGAETAVELREHFMERHNRPKR